MKKNIIKFKKGFTILELMIVVFIFASMTTYLLAKYGTFNQQTLLKNLAYDVALTIRTAQSYGLNVKSVPGSANAYNFPYGVHFDNGDNCFMFFSDSVGADHIYNAGGGTCSDGQNHLEKITPYVITRGSTISDLCVGDPCSFADSLDITFKRPDPDAVIYSGNTKYNYAEITLMSSDGSTAKVIVRSTGQIEIQ